MESKIRIESNDFTHINWNAIFHKLVILIFIYAFELQSLNQPYLIRSLLSIYYNDLVDWNCWSFLYQHYYVAQMFYVSKQFMSVKWYILIMKIQ